MVGGGEGGGRGNGKKIVTRREKEPLWRRTSRRGSDAGRWLLAREGGQRSTGGGCVAGGISIVIDWPAGASEGLGAVKCSAWELGDAFPTGKNLGGGFGGKAPSSIEAGHFLANKGGHVTFALEETNLDRIE